MNTAKVWCACALAFASFALLVPNAKAASHSGGVAAAEVAGAPVIEPLPSLDTHWSRRDHSTHRIQIRATNSPTSYEATGLPANVSFDSAQGFIEYGYAEIAPGQYDVKVSASNAAGTGTQSFVWRVHPVLYDIAPDKPVYTSTYEGIAPYQAGDLLRLKASFLGNVFVTGTPYLLIHGNRRALYASGSGTQELVFEYQTVAEDGGFNEWAPSEIHLDGGTITTSDGVEATLSVGAERFGLVPYIYVAYPEIRIASGVTGTVGQPYSLPQLPTGALLTYRITEGTLVPGLSLNPDTGEISGTPLEVSSENITLIATNPNGIFTGATITISVFPADGPPTLGTVTPPPPEKRGVNAIWSFAGTASPGSSVLILVEGVDGPDVPAAPVTEGPISSTPTVADAEGKWTFSKGIDTSPGGYRFTAATIDSSGKQTAVSEAISVFLSDPDTTRPRITQIVAPIVEGDTKPWSFAGSSAPGARILVKLVSGPAEGPAAGTLVSSTPVIADAFGRWKLESALSTLAGTYTFVATSVDADGNLIASSHPPVSEEVPEFSLPTVSDGAVTGQVGQPIAPVQLQASGAILSFSAPDLAAYGLSVDSTGLVTGTPTMPASAVRIAVTANSAIGTSAPATLLLNISPAPPPPEPVKADQKITFASPTGALVIGQPIMLGALSNADLPITYAVVRGEATLDGNVLTPTGTATLMLRASSEGNDRYNPASVEVTFGNPQKAAQSINVSTPQGDVPAEKAIALDATATSGMPVSYTVVSGPAVIDGGVMTFTGTGPVVVRASQSGSSTYAVADDVTLTFTAVPVPRLINGSARLHVSGHDRDGASIVGFVVTGPAPTSMLVRAVGPGLAAFGIADALAAPRLVLFDSAGHAVAQNSGWNDDATVSAAARALGAFALAGGSRDAAVLVTLPPGAYTAHVSSEADGTALIEMYDAGAAAAVPLKQLLNVSARGSVRGSEAPLIVGFVVAGVAPKRVLIRAIGPTLETLGVDAALADPVLAVHDGARRLVAQNDDWDTPVSMAGMPQPASAAAVTAAAADAGAFPLSSGSNDAAVVITLEPGAYTAVATGANGASGAALVEVYELPE